MPCGICWKASTACCTPVCGSAGGGVHDGAGDWPHGDIGGSGTWSPGLGAGVLMCWPWWASVPKAGGVVGWARSLAAAESAEPSSDSAGISPVLPSSFGVDASCSPLGIAQNCGSASDPGITGADPSGGRSGLSWSGTTGSAKDSVSESESPCSLAELFSCKRSELEAGGGGDSLVLHVGVSHNDELSAPGSTRELLPVGQGLAYPGSAGGVSNEPDAAGGTKGTDSGGSGLWCLPSPGSSGLVTSLSIESL
ncbi:Uncharacterised protein [Mycobacteroides abscessus subsp. abscessus]|nr:Uncharacterised protein [Mycobacteroides abscessus subsp. abscessus]